MSLLDVDRKEHQSEGMSIGRDVIAGGGLEGTSIRKDIDVIDC